MEKKLICLPTEEELRNRIQKHLLWRGGSRDVALLWRGYIAALMEWGLIEVETYSRIVDIVPKCAEKEVYELFSGEPISPEIDKEIDIETQRR